MNNSFCKPGIKENSVNSRSVVIEKEFGRNSWQNQNMTFRRSNLPNLCGKEETDVGGYQRIGNLVNRKKTEKIYSIDKEVFRNVPKDFIFSTYDQLFPANILIFK